MYLFGKDDNKAEYIENKYFECDGILVFCKIEKHAL